MLSVDVEVLAWPLTSMIGLPGVPSIVNVTVPVGVPPLPDTVAVNVTVWPNVLGFADEFTLVVVAVPALTVSMNVLSLLEAKVLSPL
jgi:hypothetical protein